MNQGVAFLFESHVSLLHDFPLEGPRFDDRRDVAIAGRHLESREELLLTTTWVAGLHLLGD